MLVITPQASAKGIKLKGSYQLFSSHEKAVNLLDGSGNLISLHPSLDYLSPFGMVLRPTDFDYVRSQCHIARNISFDGVNSLVFPGCRVTAASREIDLRVRHTEWTNDDLVSMLLVVGQKNGFGHRNFHMLASNLSPLDTLVEYIYLPTLRNARQVAHHIGSGSGLTPSYDDALVGLLSVIYMTDKASKFLPSLLTVMQELDLGQLTTTVSKSFLFCALHGEVSYPLYRLLSSFRHRKSCLQQNINQFIRHGHTSGLDTLLGIAAAIQYLE